MEFIRGALSWVELNITQLVITLIIVTVYQAYKKIEVLHEKYQSLNTLVARHGDEIYRISGMRFTKQHRSLDYEPISPLFDRDPIESHECEINLDVVGNCFICKKPIVRFKGYVSQQANED